MAGSAICQECGEDFRASRSDAKWCSDRCRKAAGRRAAPHDHHDRQHDDGGDSGLVGSVRAELDAAGVAETFAGQLALALAKRLSHPDESGISSLSKELRTVMAAALAGVTPPASEEEKDEVAKAREARERKARQAAGRA